jgi:transcriptional regulator with XRE-family HTH domain
MTETAGQLLKRLRREADRTQRSIASAIGVTDSAVSEWERDGSLPSRSTAKALDTALGAGGRLEAAFNDAAPERTITRRGDSPNHTDELALLLQISQRLEALETRLDALEAQDDPTPDEAPADTPTEVRRRPTR